MKTIPPTQVFWCEPTGKIRRFLRCYSSDDGMQRGAGERADEPIDPARCRSYCNAMRFLDEIEEEFEGPRDQARRYRKQYEPGEWPWDAFPNVCEACGKEMKNPTRQVFMDEILVVKTGPRAGQEFARRDLPVGAMWHVGHYDDIPEWQGRDGIALQVMTPDGEWHVDGRANNCTMPDDKVHRCWVRHGDPRTGYVTVDKEATPEFPTCNAGAGSIWMKAPDGWHGFLYRGYLCDAGDKGAVDALFAPRPLPAAERVLKVHQVDAAPRPIVVKAHRPASGPTRAFGAWRSNRRR